MDTKEMIERIAPCSLLCYTCEAYEKGIICESAKTLLLHMDGMKEFHQLHHPELEERYTVFEEELKRCSAGACSGCRSNEHNICSIESCFILECTQNHNVYFCGECPEFPCGKPEKLFEEQVYQQWLNGNQEIKKNGVKAYYEKNCKKSHYRAYKPSTNEEEVYLRPMTAQMYMEYFKEYQNDLDLYIDQSTYQPYSYSEEKVKQYIKRQIDLKRKTFAIMYGDEMVGELIIKNIEEKKCATLGIALRNTKYKDKGFGSKAEQLAVQYVFHELDIPVLYADCILSNKRSQHVLEKVGFKFIKEEGDFRYYCIER